MHCAWTHCLTQSPAHKFTQKGFIRAAEKISDYLSDGKPCLSECVFLERLDQISSKLHNVIHFWLRIPGMIVSSLLVGAFSSAGPGEPLEGGQ